VAQFLIGRSIVEERAYPLHDGCAARGARLHLLGTAGAADDVAAGHKDNLDACLHAHDALSRASPPLIILSPLRL
tara:strand:- start:304 stop:528 length:225 start_codon:yes stop_codon:yes gene_type:complete